MANIVDELTIFGCQAYSGSDIASTVKAVFSRKCEKLSFQGTYKMNLSLEDIETLNQVYFFPRSIERNMGWGLLIFSYSPIYLHREYAE